MDWTQKSSSEWKGVHRNGGNEDWWYKTTTGDTAYHEAACGNLFLSHSNGEEISTLIGAALQVLLTGWIMSTLILLSQVKIKFGTTNTVTQKPKPYITIKTGPSSGSRT